MTPFAIDDWQFVEHVRRAGIGDHFVVTHPGRPGERFHGTVFPPIPETHTDELMRLVAAFPQPLQLDCPDIIPLFHHGILTVAGSVQRPVVITAWTDPAAKLAAILQPGKAIGHREALIGTCSLLDALSTIDNAGLYHGRVDPDAITIDAHGRFTLSDPIHARYRSLVKRCYSTGTGDFQFTFEAPEALRGGRLSIHSDIFSAAALLYRCLTGHAPFPQSTALLLDPGVTRIKPMDPKHYDPDINDACAAVLGRGLKLDPNKRYTDPYSFQVDVMALLAGKEPAALLDKRQQGHGPTPPPTRAQRTPTADAPAQHHTSGSDRLRGDRRTQAKRRQRAGITGLISFAAVMIAALAIAFMAVQAADDNETPTAAAPARSTSNTQRPKAQPATAAQDTPMDATGPRQAMHVEASNEPATSPPVTIAASSSVKLQPVPVPASHVSLIGILTMPAAMSPPASNPAPAAAAAEDSTSDKLARDKPPTDKLALDKPTTQTVVDDVADEPTGTPIDHEPAPQPNPRAQPDIPIALAEPAQPSPGDLLFPMRASVSFNFGDDDAPLQDGYHLVRDQVFGQHGDFTFGLHRKPTEDRDLWRKGSAGGDIIRETVLKLYDDNGPLTWELEVPNGRYRVDLICGDPTKDESLNHIMVENKGMRDSGASRSPDVYECLVTINDGRLTLTPMEDAHKPIVAALRLRRLQ